MGMMVHAGAPGGWSGTKGVLRLGAGTRHLSLSAGFERKEAYIWADMLDTGPAL